MLGELPKELNINGKVYPVNTDYRNILTIIEAFGDEELEDREKAYICLKRLFGGAFLELKKDEYEAALKEALEFIECRIHDERPSPKVVNWSKDEQLIFPAVNKVAGMEVRAVEYMHWWTFLGYFQNISSEDTWGYVLMLRQKKAKGKSLEKHEREFWRSNIGICSMKEVKQYKSAQDRQDAIFESLLMAEQGNGQ